MRKLAWITAVFLTVSAWIGFATGPTYQHLSLTSTLAAAVTINPTVASESEQAISILSLSWDQDEMTAVQAPQSVSPLPDKFLFAVGAQAPVGQFNYPYRATFALDSTINMGQYKQLPQPTNTLFSKPTNTLCRNLRLFHHPLFTPGLINLFTDLARNDHYNAEKER